MRTGRCISLSGCPLCPPGLRLLGLRWPWARLLVSAEQPEREGDGVEGPLNPHAPSLVQVSGPSNRPGAEGADASQAGSGARASGGFLTPSGLIPKLVFWA